MSELNKIAVEFFEKKYQHFVLKVKVKQNHQIAYSGDDMYKMMEFVKYQDQLEEFEKNFVEFIEANEEHLDMEELHKLAELEEYKVTSERQKELSKELINKEYTVDELIELVK